jgi:LmbE family N-acetylglucosaminyl deacetylase
MNLIGEKEIVLVLSPHTDDGELSAGGTISRLIDQGNEIHYAAFSCCENTIKPPNPSDILRTECEKALKTLGLRSENVRIFDFPVRMFPHKRQEILDRLVDMAITISPTIVICPSSFDVHQDHDVINKECVRAFKKTASIWGMEHPWNNLSFRTDIFVELSDRNIANKINALKQYSSQSYREYFDEEYIKALAYTRGMNIGTKYAEVFECIRLRT